MLHSDFNSVVYRYSFPELQKSKNFEVLSTELKGISKNDVQTIYYSPHYDYKYNLNFDEIDVYDISFDKILEKDLDDLDYKDANSGGGKYSPSQELIFKNSVRQLYFLSSPIVKKNQIFKDIFELPNHGEAKLFFRGHIKNDPWNTPNEFRWVLEIIKEKLEAESSDWHKIRIFDDKHNVSNQVDVNKYILKRNILKYIISVLERQMEKENSFLTEGKISIESFRENSINLDAFNSFLLFIKNSKIEINNSKWNAFNYESISLLLHTLYEYIEEIEKEDFVKNDNIKIEPSKIINILNLHRGFLINLFNYFPKKRMSDKEEPLFDESNRIEGFINYIPVTKKLSSGENALLNLFSRFYAFITNNLVQESKYLQDKKHYIILLDEADLAFHPSWKKKFIKSIVSTIPYFFNELNVIPSLQIIFTTHDPLTLSDMPQSNVIYLDKNIDNLSYVNQNKAQSFGANVYDLLADSFFLGDNFMGDFAKDKIEGVINWINESKKNKKEILKEEYLHNKKIISIIDEPVIRIKLAEMLEELMVENTDFQKEMIQKEIDFLQNKKNSL